MDNLGSLLGVGLLTEQADGQSARKRREGKIASEKRKLRLSAGLLWLRQVARGSRRHVCSVTNWNKFWTNY